MSISPTLRGNSCQFTPLYSTVRDINLFIVPNGLGYGLGEVACMSANPLSLTSSCMAYLARRWTRRSKNRHNYGLHFSLICYYSIFVLYKLIPLLFEYLKSKEIQAFLVKSKCLQKFLSEIASDSSFSTGRVNFFVSLQIWHQRVLGPHTRSTRHTQIQQVLSDCSQLAIWNSNWIKGLNEKGGQMQQVHCLIWSWPWPHK